MRKAIATAAAIVAVVAALISLAARKPAPPQYVFMLCFDATRPDHLSCYGYSVKTTPRLDQLAAHGVVFDDAVSQAPWTTPSVATIMSSSFPCQHGARRSEGSRVPYTGLATNFIESLGPQGWQTGLFTGGLAIDQKIPSADLTRGVLTWLKENKDKRCFAVIHNYGTHSPYVADAECIEALDPGYRGRFRLSFGDFDVLKQARVGRLGEVLHLTDADLKHVKALYDCQIMSADAALGTLVDSLKTWGLLKRSMIIVFADHGEEFLEHGSIDHGQTVYEETIRVPLVIYCPSLVSRAKRIPEQVGLIDLAPTILDILGYPKPAEFEGRSLAPLFSSHFKASPDSIRPCGLPYRYLVAESIARRSEKKALRCPPWKLIFDPVFGGVELYDISKDPHETNNLIDTRPEVAARLTHTLLVLEKYYPGGWCIAWRGPASGAVSGKVEVDSSLVESLAHNFYPELDTRTDSLTTSGDWRQTRFLTGAADGWKAVEIRMADRACGTINLKAKGATGAPSQAPSLLTTLGKGTSLWPFPIKICPDSARVDRSNLHDLFRSLDLATGAPGGSSGRASWQCVVYWLEPGSEPTAKVAKDRELRKQLKAIGYIE
ncbi:MAG TPA: sulfatase [bacterium]|nr:sulfatase [bacterium]